MTQRVNRTHEQVVFGTWRDYLRKHSPELVSFCEVLRQCGAPIHRAEVDAAERRLEAATSSADEEKQRQAAEGVGFAEVNAGLPWLTPVLGSGCLTELPPNAEQAVSAHVSKGLKECGIDGDTLLDGRPVASVVNRFAHALLAARYPHAASIELTEAVDGTPTAPESVMAVRTLLAASLLQELVTEACAIAAKLQDPAFVLGETDRVVLAGTSRKPTNYERSCCQTFDRA